MANEEIRAHLRETDRIRQEGLAAAKRKKPATGVAKVGERVESLRSELLLIQDARKTTDHNKADEKMFKDRVKEINRELKKIAEKLAKG